ncbi:MAG: hypothetical protein NXH75_06665, partial [Halobacteriovoraceae bacterium]|nr:hypothetical protein [Halobacteriovoraceae bacterium]
MENKSKLHRYYLYGLLPAIIVWALISAFVNQIYAVFYLLGFTWPFMYYTPGFEEKANSRSYRFSFLGNLFKAQNSLFERLPENPAPWMVSLLRLAIPLIFTGLLSIINPSFSPLWTIFGWGMFEGFAFLNKKKNWGF